MGIFLCKEDKSRKGKKDCIPRQGSNSQKMKLNNEVGIMWHIAFACFWGQVNLRRKL